MSALYPLLGVGGAQRTGGVWTQCVGQVAHFNLTPETPLYVDGLICYHSCCQVLQLNLTAHKMVANQAINIKEWLLAGSGNAADWRQVLQGP